jgi:triosephosphate isomerase
MRKKIVAGNWKMNTDKDGAIALAKGVLEAVKNEAPKDVIVIMCTPFIHLSTIQSIVSGTPNVFVGAQNCSNKPSGAYTGEISAAMLKSYGIQYVIVGHSERREYYKESNAEIAEKVNLLLQSGLTPIFCCGEVLAERNANQQKEVVGKQLAESIFHLSADDFAKIVIAYEPVWAIGTGVTATTAQAQEIHAEIRKMIAVKYGQSIADATPILYGGSCKPDNAKELFACPDVDGGLIGGASLKATDFIGVIKGFQV